MSVFKIHLFITKEVVDMEYQREIELNRMVTAMKFGKGFAAEDSFSGSAWESCGEDEAIAKFAEYMGTSQRETRASCSTRQRSCSTNRSSGRGR
jgi:hypothetical protein